MRLASLHVLVAQARQDIDIELVVRENHEVLEVLRIGTGVVVKAVQRIVDARGAAAVACRWRSRRPWRRAQFDAAVRKLLL
jgi:hypothetical protein